MVARNAYLCLLLAAFSLLPVENNYATIDKIRAILREDPTTTMSIAWNQISGENPILHYGRIDAASNLSQYEYQIPSAKSIQSKGMHTHFVHLSNLQANTIYYFVIQDSEGISARYYFKTASDDPNTKLSIISGGNSTLQRNANINSNKMVAKLRPDVVLFNGNMTTDNSAVAWQNWLDDWQYTITSDGRLTPIVPSAGNLQESQNSLSTLFDIKNTEAYYALTFGKGLLRLYVLNTFIASNIKQKDWLENDLNRHQQAAWRIAQYHHHLRQNTETPIANEQLKRLWGSIFQLYKINIALESELNHTTISPFLKTSSQENNEAGFIQEQGNGTHFISAGSWSNAQISASSVKKWTENAPSYSNFHWFFIDLQKIEIRTVYTSNVQEVQALTENNRFTLPANLNIAQYGDKSVFTLLNKSTQTFVPQDNFSGIQLSKVAARIMDDKVHLSWSAFCELDGANFHIQSSTNKISWTSVGYLKVRHTDPQDGFFQYEYKHNLPEKGGKLFYRITLLDSLGKEKTKRDVELRTLGNEKMELIQASVTNGQLIVDLDLAKDQEMLLEILDTKLQPVFIQQLPYLRGRHTIPLNLRHLQAGYYLLEITYGPFLYRKNIYLSRAPISESLK